MNVHLTPDLEQLVQTKMRSGHYSSASEVVREALRLMGERDEVLQIRKGEIRRKISQGLKSLRDGGGVDGDEAFRQLDERHELYRRRNRE